jgi:hypothetical protein
VLPERPLEKGTTLKTARGALSVLGLAAILSAIACSSPDAQSSPLETATPSPQVEPAVADATQVVVSPSTAIVAAGETVPLTATVTGAVQTVGWSVAEGSAGGTLSASVYTAPGTAGTYHVVATSTADPTKSGTSTITVIASAPSAPTVTPPPTPTPTGPQFYVALDGNDANPGTLAQPWRTIQKAMSSATAGSTVNIRGGTYQERLSMNVQGTSGNPITFQPYGFSVPAGGCGGYTGVACGGEQVILDYAYLGTDSNTTPLLYISSKSYVRIQGLTLQNYSCIGAMKIIVRIDGTSSFVEFKYNKIQYSQNVGAWDGTNALMPFRIWGPASNVTVYGNELHHLTTSYGETLTIGAYGGTPVANATVERNYIHDVDAIGIDIQVQSYGWSIKNNRLDYISKKADGSYWYNNPAVAIYSDGGIQGVMEGNYVSNAGAGFEALAEPGQPSIHDIAIRNNIVTSSVHGVVIGTWYSDTDGSTVSNIKVFNNTFYGNQNGVVIRPMVASTVSWKNNIFANNSSNYTNTGGWNPGTADFNLYWGSNTGPDAHKITADPLFMSAAAGDFRLQSGSPAINMGDSTTTTADAGTVDFKGAPRIQNRIDVGAHEMQ